MANQPHKEETKLEHLNAVELPSSDLGNLPVLLNEANKALEKTAPQSFSEQAFKSLKQNITTYIIELVGESIRNARREKVDSVSASHVEKASSYLVTKNRGKLKSILGAVGGVFLGAAVQEIVGVLNSATPPNSISVITISALMLVGTILVAWNLLSDK